MLEIYLSTFFTMMATLVVIIIKSKKGELETPWKYKTVAHYIFISIIPVVNTIIFVLLVWKWIKSFEFWENDV